MRPYLRTEWLRGLIKDEGGGVLVYMTILIPVMMGIIGLAVDASRLFILNTEQKDLADAAAIAGAYELDGKSDALTRAETAARNVVTNDPRWASDPEPEAQIISIRYCEHLTGPAHLRECDGYTTEPRDAYHIEVITEVRRVFPSFLVAVGAVTEPRSDAWAIAGSSIVACNVQSLMICNPYENAEPALSEPFTANKGQTFIFKAKDVGAPGPDTEPQAFSPGDFGLVDHPDYPSGKGAPATRALLSLQARPICIQSVVSPHQGHETNMVNQGINVRFDRKYSCTGTECADDITAAPHVLKGSEYNSCTSPNPSKIWAERRYPPDTESTFIPEGGSLAVGNGVMDIDKKNKYWELHHGAGVPWPGDLQTRYDAYLRELEMIKTNAWGPDDPPLEDPEAVCLPVSEAGAERRVFNAAVIDCLKWGVKGNKVNNIRVDAYVEFFITQPSDDGEINTEFVRMMTPDTDGTKLKRIVQLYR